MQESPKDLGILLTLILSLLLQLFSVIKAFLKGGSHIRDVEIMQGVQNTILQDVKTLQKDVAELKGYIRGHNGL